MSNDYRGISNMEIQKRLTDSSTNFSMQYRTDKGNSDFRSGNPISFSLSGINTAIGIEVISGYLQRVRRTDRKASRVFTLSGRDKGFFLVKQPFNWNPTLGTGNYYDMQTLLLNILNQTGINLGRELTPGSNPSFTTQGDATDSWYGEFSTKKAALDSLFEKYRISKGLNKVRWFVDMGGNLNWFEIGKNNIGNIQYITEDTPYVTEIETEDNAENIINDLTGFGCNDETVFAHRRIEESVSQYGLQIGDPITDSTVVSSATMERLVLEELNQKAWPLYTAKVTFSKFYDVEPGMQVKFPEDDMYSDLIFTIVDKAIKGKQADYTTTFNAVTSDTSMSIINEVDALQAMITKAIQATKARRAVVVETDPETGYMLVRPFGSNNLIFARSR
ncbi:MAG: hypothetical protein AMQ22_01340 [Candidatus Methanofastidiosum methylothiophilum]|uniref:Uncharacterized protein n=1 Tax=Candidatus Methanofastidiosum methylothiophilum TaxID=1705564 RepID=A0A150J2G7_9EURY|nr:MAG: hypothetical protein AMQ22_01340 [Candidatus Methanofastidiosum methylthiophilus]